MLTSESILEKGKAGYSALYLLSSEEQRSLGEVKKAAKDLKRKLFIWTYGEGKGLFPDEQKVRSGDKPKPIDGTESPPDLFKVMADPLKIPEGSIVVLRLFHHFIEDVLVQSSLKDLINEFKTTKKMIIILTPVLKLPPELEKDFALLEVELPGQKDLKLVLEGITKNLDESKRPSEDRIKELVQAALGLTTTEAENAFSLSLVRPNMQNVELWDPKIVMAEKCAALKKTGILEYIPIDDINLNAVGGMENLKEFVRKRKRAFTDEARAYGLPMPKGILLLGPPGTGKSLGAKAVSGELVLPLLRLDMGKVYGGLVGQSESNIRLALATAEALAPCVLWVDEIEKGMAGGAGALDSGVGQRVQGTILTWMQEKKHPVFVYATANQPTLPPEMVRKGRFDEMFSVDLPSDEERQAIFEIHLKKRGRLDSVIKAPRDYRHLIQASLGFTGAEIEAAIEDALFSSFGDSSRDLALHDVIDAIDSTQPQSKIMSENIEAIRNWTKKRCRPANKGETVNLSLVTSGGGRKLEA